MKQGELAYIIANGKIKLRAGDRLLLYFSLVPIALMLIGGCMLIYKAYNDEHDVNSAFWGPLVLFISISAMWLVIKRQKQNRTYKAVETPFLKDENSKLVAAILERTSWKVEKRPEYIVCSTRKSGFSWGEVVTVIPLDKKILINSHPKNGKMTILRDIRNIEKLQNEIRTAISNAAINNNRNKVI
ncbi:MAG: hypothetical protein K0Q79_1021 [Flavipsychrobacter sp.]|jgi:hypothetical protein|nr:hypothetical protein [Flavipsychrobacter sp.]